MAEDAAALIIKPYWADKIFHGGKTKEIRNTPAHHRGDTYVAVSGSMFLLGYFDLYDCEGPLTEERWAELRPQHLVPGKRPYGASTYAWSVRSARLLRYRVPCARSTQVKWVRYASVCNASWRTA